MDEPSKQELIEYVADLAAQPAILCRDDYPETAEKLRHAEKSARNLNGQPLS